MACLGVSVSNKSFKAKEQRKHRKGNYQRNNKRNISELKVKTVQIEKCFKSGAQYTD